MAFTIGTKKELSPNSEMYKSVHKCNICGQTIKSTDPIIIQYDMAQIPFSITTVKASKFCTIHAKCLITNIRKMQPDFWERYMVELI